MQARVLSLFVITLSLWFFGSAYMFLHCANTEYAVWIDRWIYVIVSAIPAVVFHFGAVLTKVRWMRRVIPIGYGLMAVFWVLVWSPLFVDGLYQFENGCHSQARALHHVFLLYFVVYSNVVLVTVFYAYRREQDVVRKGQLQFLFIALLAQAVVGTSAFLPAYNINSMSFSYFSGILTVLILAYAMFRHNLFELRVIAMKLFSTLVIVAAGFQIFLVDTMPLRFVNAVIFMIIVVLGTLVTRNVKEEIENREKGERLARYLANANARLRELDKQKTEFVSVASHQLRSPIAAIVGYTSNLVEGTYGEVPEKLQQPLMRVLESGKRISFIVDDFLNVSRIEQGRMSYTMEPHNVGDIVAQSIAELKILADQKHISLELLEPPEPIVVVGDEGKLKQIFSNLIDNALKYTEQGSIRVEIRKQEQGKRALVAISDTGIGIAGEEVEKLFHKFNRASNANTANVHGTGLGLYIAKEIMKAHRGWIHVDSKGIGQGSTFTVDLPLASETERPT